MASTSEIVALAVVLLGLACSRTAAAQQTCNDATSSLPSSRFHDNGDGTVSDLTSGLMWMRCAGGQTLQGQRCAGQADAYGWRAAAQYADQVSRDGAAFFNDWRVPALRELATITDRGCSSPRTNLAVFPGTPSAAFWSSTQRPGDRGDDRALALHFGADGVMLARKDERFHVRLVRTGP